MSMVSELEPSMISFAGSDSTWASYSKFIARGIPRGKPIGVGSGAFIQGRRLFEGSDWSRDSYYSMKYGIPSIIWNKVPCKGLKPTRKCLKKAHCTWVSCAKLRRWGTSNRPSL